MVGIRRRSLDDPVLCGSPDLGLGVSGYRYSIYVGRLLFAFGVGLLAPMSGTAILLAGEITLVLRLMCRNRAHTGESARTQEPALFPSIVPARSIHANWKKGFRKEASNGVLRSQ